MGSEFRPRVLAPCVLLALVAVVVLTAADSFAQSPDLIAPVVSITAPADSITVSGRVRVRATATDDVGVAGVQFQLDGAPLAAEDPSWPFQRFWNTTSATDGSHTLTAVARDAAGNQTMSPPIIVIVSNTTATDSTPPV